MDKFTKLRQLQLLAICDLDVFNSKLIFSLWSAVACHYGLFLAFTAFFRDDIRVMVTVWRLRGNIIRTALCWIVWHNVHSQQHTYMSSSNRSHRLGLSHWDPYIMRRGRCLELYYCNMVEWFWWDSSLISTTNWFQLSPKWPLMCWLGR